MKKLFLFTTVALGLFTACSSNTEKKSDAASDTAMQQMEMSADTAASTMADSTNAAADKTAKDSADAAHGHSH
ncbi:MAG: hypothetical protein ACYCZO_14860 [Daejeonella sp.]